MGLTDSARLSPLRSLDHWVLSHSLGGLIPKFGILLEKVTILFQSDMVGVGGEAKACGRQSCSFHLLSAELMKPEKEVEWY